MRKWLPAVLIGACLVLAAAVLGRLPDGVLFPSEGLLPPPMGGAADSLPRLVAAFGLPVLALFVWAVLFEAPVGPLGRLGMRLFPDAPPVRYELFADEYRLIVIWVVCIFLSLHLALLAGALGWPVHGGRIVGITFGAGLMMVGNLFPRLRPNAVAGLRTPRTMTDPVLWARVHRAFGAVWVVAGALTLVVALVAPRYALVTGVVALALSGVAGMVIMRSMVWRVVES